MSTGESKRREERREREKRKERGESEEEREARSAKSSLPEKRPLLRDPDRALRRPLVFSACEKSVRRDARGRKGDDERENAHHSTRKAIHEKFMADE